MLSSLLLLPIFSASLLASLGLASPFDSPSQIASNGTFARQYHRSHQEYFQSVTGIERHGPKRLQRHCTDVCSQRRGANLVDNGNFQLDSSGAYPKAWTTVKFGEGTSAVTSPGGLCQQGKANCSSFVVQASETGLTTSLSQSLELCSSRSYSLQFDLGVRKLGHACLILVSLSPMYPEDAPQHFGPFLDICPSGAETCVSGSDANQYQHFDLPLAPLSTAGPVTLEFGFDCPASGVGGSYDYFLDNVSVFS